MDKQKIELTELDKLAGMRCWCGSFLHLDAEKDQYICADCGQPEDDCECEYH